MIFSHTRVVYAPPERVWAVWNDVAGWPRWDTELVSASLAGNFAEGSKRTLKPRGAPTSSFTLTEVTPGRSYTFTTTLPLGELHVRRTLGSGPEVTFTHEVRSTGLSAPFGALLGRRYRRALPVAMAGLREIVEAKRTAT